MEYRFKNVVLFLLIGKNTSILRTASPFTQKCQLSDLGLRTKIAFTNTQILLCTSGSMYFRSRLKNTAFVSIIKSTFFNE